MLRAHNPVGVPTELDDTQVEEAVNTRESSTPPVPIMGTTRPYWDIVPAGLSIALGIAALVFSEEMSDGVGGVPGARFWPAILGWALIGLGAALAVSVWLPRRVRLEAPDAITGNGVLKLALTTAVLVGYLSFWGVLPFWIITLVTSIVLMTLFGMRGWKALVLFPVIIVAIIQFLFIVALRIPL